jgi:predicted ATP-grasp superfamily ATP-dependent carboligase
VTRPVDLLAPEHGSALDTGTPAVVLRLAPNIFHHGTLGVIRSLGRAGIEVHALLESGTTPASRSRYLHRRHPIPPPEADTEQVLASLREISEELGRRALLVPVDDAGAILVAERAAELEPRFLLPRQVRDLPRRVADKGSLVDVCRAAGVAHPPTVVVRVGDEVSGAVERLGLPLVAKWSRPWEAQPTPTTVVHTEGEAEALAALVGVGGAELLLQRRLPPAPEADWFFHGYFDESSRCLFGGSGRKERAYPPQAGLTTLGRWLPNPAVEELATRLAAHLGYRGVLDLDLRRDPDTGEYHLLDFNPRLGAQFRLFTDGQGLDVVRAEHLDLTGRPVPNPIPQHGRAFLVETYDPVSAALQVGRRTLGVGQWARSLRGVRELAWYSTDDVRPGLVVAPRWCAACYHRLRAGGRPASGSG